MDYYSSLPEETKKVVEDFDRACEHIAEAFEKLAIKLGVAVANWQKEYVKQMGRYLIQKGGEEDALESVIS